MPKIILIGLWCLFAGINILIAKQNNKTRLRRISQGITKQIEHPIWGAVYLILCSSFLFIHYAPFQHRLFLSISLLLQHLSIFPVAYNLFSKEPAFHLSTTTTAITDRIMVWLGFKDTEKINIIAFVVSIAYLIKLISMTI